MVGKFFGIQVIVVRVLTFSFSSMWTSNLYSNTSPVRHCKAASADTEAASLVDRTIRACSHLKDIILQIANRYLNGISDLLSFGQSNTTILPHLLNHTSLTSLTHLSGQLSSTFLYTISSITQDATYALAINHHLSPTCHLHVHLVYTHHVSCTS